MNIQELIQYIELNIKANGVRSITGTVLQQILVEICENIAPSEVSKPLKISDPLPTEDGTYLAVESGTYSNGITVDLNEGVTYLVLKEEVWSKTVYPINFTLTGVVEEGNTQAVSGGTVYDTTNSISENIKSSISDDIIKVNYNIIENSYIVPNDGGEANSLEWNASDFIPFQNNLLTQIIPLKDYISLAFYDENKIFVNLQKYSTNRNYGFSNLENVSYFRFSWKKTELFPPKLILQKIGKYRNKTNENLIKQDELINGFFINQNDGGVTTLNGYSVTPYIDVAELNSYLLNNVYQQYAFFDKYGYYISNNQSANNAKNIVPPIGASWFRGTQENGSVNSFKMITNGSVISNERTLYVKKIGGDFNVIQKAIDYANSTGLKHTIIVDTGEWQENLLCNTGIGHTIKGVSKNDTIIFNAGSINDILKVKSGWYFKDLTFDQRYGAYAIHLDYAGGGLLEFDNCKIKTKYGSAVGSGSFAGQTLRFRNCEIHQIGFWNENGVFYWHNATQSGGAEQRLEMYWCDIYSADGSKVLRLDDANQLSGDGLGNSATVLFIGNNFYSKGNTPNSNILVDLRANNTPTGNLVGCIKLDERSWGNNIPILNY